MEIDHKTPLNFGGGKYDLENLQCLCRNHHFAKTKLDNKLLNPPKPWVGAWRELIEIRKML